MKKIKKIIKLKVIILCLFVTPLIIFTLGGKTASAKEMETLFLDLYQNRLIAETYIYKLNTNFAQKKIDLIEQNYKKEFFISSSHSDSITNLLASYSKTKLTQEEEGVFESLKRHIAQARVLELSATEPDVRTFNLTTNYNKVLFDLNALSAIQLKEAGNLFKEVYKNSSMSLVESELFWALGIVALLIIVSVLKSEDIPSSTKQSYLLN